jgi:hypothetical protein
LDEIIKDDVPKAHSMDNIGPARDSVPINFSASATTKNTGCMHTQDVLKVLEQVPETTLRHTGRNRTTRKNIEVYTLCELGRLDGLIGTQRSPTPLPTPWPIYENGLYEKSQWTSKPSYADWILQISL